MKQKKTYQIVGMHCASCAILIEGELADRGIDGVCDARTNMLTVESSTTLSDEDVHAAVKAAGYRIKSGDPT